MNAPWMKKPEQPAQPVQPFEKANNAGLTEVPEFGDRRISVDGRFRDKENTTHITVQFHKDIVERMKKVSGSTSQNAAINALVDYAIYVLERDQKKVIVDVEERYTK